MFIVNGRGYHKSPSGATCFGDDEWYQVEHVAPTELWERINLPICYKHTTPTGLRHGKSGNQSLTCPHLKTLRGEG